MALTPNNIYQLNDIEIKEHLIPDGAVWKDDTKAKNAGFRGAGAAYKANVLLGRGSGKVSGVVVHNTGRGRYIGVRCTEDGDVAEVYTRACYPNENLNSARVHLFLSEIGCWQSLRMGTGLVSTDPLGTAEVAWSTSDGTDGLGNNNCIAIECCMDDTANSYNSEIEARASKIIAYLLYSNSLNINQLYTHTYFVNNMNGDKFENVDTQNTHKPSSGKYCPIYILPHWATFKAQVEAELAILNGDTPIVEPTIYVGDHAYLTENALFTSGKTPKKWVYSTNLLVLKVDTNTAEVSANEKDYTGTVYIKDLINITHKEDENVIKVGDYVMANGNALFANGATPAKFVYGTKLLVLKADNEQVQVSANEKDYTGTFNIADVAKIKDTESATVDIVDNNAASEDTAKTEIPTGTPSETETPTETPTETETSTETPSETPTETETSAETPITNPTTTNWWISFFNWLKSLFKWLNT